MATSVLVVDDTAFMRLTLKNLLTKNGFSVVGEAENGEDAVQKYFELKPDVVTMDITMPKMDGIVALKSILQRDPSAKIIVCSAMGQKPLVIEALASGAKDFIVKPFQPDRVVEALNKVMSGGSA
ncbi:MAG TPA: response regulator [Firmicutes bacterium]|nr:response regulator [Bacillota bacterium]